VSCEVGQYYDGTLRRCGHCLVEDSFCCGRPAGSKVERQRRACMLKTSDYCNIEIRDPVRHLTSAGARVQRLTTISLGGLGDCFDAHAKLPETASLRAKENVPPRWTAFVRFTDTSLPVFVADTDSIF
jgi:hypothetical protein